MTDKREQEHDAILAALHAFERSEKPAPFNQMKEAVEAYFATLRQPASVEVEPVALLRDIADEVRDPDGAGTLPTDLMARIDAHLADKVQS